ncbi:hypothetical protein MTR67_007640 [Solanum verrucosum]|uniref:ATP-dependent Clp protease proteolytic subunit n=1 Tax=Solanum verrucosum TaxID=315347 RepID=A0AAF0Q2C9_SOLVR|nr:hypothetical protein MTR67_007640 [Solanum verrucosum]
MHRISCFNGIFYPGRRTTYQTYSIPSRLAPMRVMIHEPYSAFYMAQVGEFVMEAVELMKLRETLTRVYAERTGKPFWVVHEDMERDIFMSATEAQAYGIVDFVAVQGK